MPTDPVTGADLREPQWRDVPSPREVAGAAATGDRDGPAGAARAAPFAPAAPDGGDAAVGPSGAGVIRHRCVLPGAKASVAAEPEGVRC